MMMMMLMLRVYLNNVHPPLDTQIIGRHVSAH